MHKRPWMFGNKNGETHGMSKTPEHKVWIAMRHRCNNPKNAHYRNYGGRGIRVCERWDDFTKFISDLGPRPTPGHTLERIDNDGDYCPENVCWATRRTQTRNRRIKRLLTLNGETHPTWVWARRLGVPLSRLHSRLHRGWSERRTLTQPFNVRIRASNKHLLNIYE